MNTLEFFRYRWRFRSLDVVRFPAGKSGNVLRGAFGIVLRETATPAVYARIFNPAASQSAHPDGEKSPSGLADWPRPFLFRTAAVDGLTITPGAAFSIDMHLFEVRTPLESVFADAFRRLETTGLGPGRGRVRLEGVDRLDLEDRATADACTVALDPPGPAADCVRVRFLTPTELKAGGEIAGRPEFASLFARLRDRIANLSRLYGAQPIETDFREMGERAAAVRLAACDIAWERVERKSSRTGQAHWMGGFTGEAEYRGALTEFLPWLHAARWTGVGRQTVWGKGDMRVLP